MSEAIKKGACIFDIDGTLADHSHRIHLVDGSSKKKYFDQYHDLCPKDPPNRDVVTNAIKMGEQGHRIVIMTGRPESHRPQTEEWLAKHGVKYDLLLMRPTKDMMRSREMKLQWAKEHIGLDNIAAVWEDKHDVVQMWVDQKIPFVFALPDLAIKGTGVEVYHYGTKIGK